jgi:hypothetical protein
VFVGVRLTLQRSGELLVGDRAGQVAVEAAVADVARSNRPPATTCCSDARAAAWRTGQIALVVEVESPRRRIPSNLPSDLPRENRVP